MSTCNLTGDGKIRTIRYLKATHDDFSKLVDEGKKVLQDITDMEQKCAVTFEQVIAEVTENPKRKILIDGQEQTLFWLYTYFLRKQSILDGYNKAYKFLMEEGVDELLLSIDVGAESYNYNFYQLCLYS